MLNKHQISGGEAYLYSVVLYWFYILIYFTGTGNSFGKCTLKFEYVITLQLKVSVSVYYIEFEYIMTLI